MSEFPVRLKECRKTKGLTQLGKLGMNDLTNRHDYISDPCLKSGRLVVVVQNGAVKGYILKRIIEACEYILEYEELERKRGGINHDKKR